jgi:hypothetical protein
MLPHGFDNPVQPADEVSADPTKRVQGFDVKRFPWWEIGTANPSRLVDNQVEKPFEMDEA